MPVYPFFPPFWYPSNPRVIECREMECREAGDWVESASHEHPTHTPRRFAMLASAATALLVLQVSLAPTAAFPTSATAAPKQVPISALNLQGQATDSIRPLAEDTVHTTTRVEGANISHGMGNQTTCTFCNMQAIKPHRRVFNSPAHNHSRKSPTRPPLSTCPNRTKRSRTSWKGT